MNGLLGGCLWGFGLDLGVLGGEVGFFFGFRCRSWGSDSGSSVIVAMDLEV